MKHNGKEYEKEYIYILCISELLCCRAEINIVNQMCFNKIFKKLDRELNGWTNEQMGRPMD